MGVIRDSIRDEEIDIIVWKWRKVINIGVIRGIEKCRWIVIMMMIKVGIMRHDEKIKIIRQ